MRLNQRRFKFAGIRTVEAAAGPWFYRDTAGGRTMGPRL